jgi:DNA-binding NtrC family response regulator
MSRKVWRRKEVDALKTNRLRILLVEGNDDSAEILLSLLEDLGYEVIRTKCTLAVLQLVDKPPYNFDLVIVSQETPVQSGADLAEDMVRIGPSMPVILYVDHVDRVLLERARKVGFSVIKKQDNPWNLLTWVGHCLQS